MKTLLIDAKENHSLYPKVAEILRNGGLVAVPTETVYGLAADGTNEKAVSEIYRVKGRPEVKPISLLVNGTDAFSLCRDVPESAYKLAEAFWPGPLTIILKRTDKVADIVTAGGETVGLRCPRHEVTLKIIEACGLPLATPSANISGQKSPKSAQDVLDSFFGKIDAVVDGGICELGIESTIVDLSNDIPRILRQGALLSSDISEVIGTVG